MALKVGELFATLNLDNSGFAEGLSSAKSSAAGAVSDIVKTLGVAKLGKDAFTAYTDFESAFAGVKKTVDETVNTSFADLEAALINMSKELPASAVEIAAVAEAAGQLGIGADSIEEFTRVMIDLGESTNLTADEAATTLARFANIMGTSENEYSNLGSAIVDLGNNFATTESEIAEMAQRMASASKQIGMSEADVLGFAAAFSSVGIESEAGGSAFSTFVSNLSLAVSQGGDDLADYAKVAGMSAKEFKQAFGEDATGAIMAFIEGLGDAEDGIGILSALGITEVRQRNALLSAANASDMFASAIDTANAAYVENNALTQEASKRYATIESRISMLKNQVTEMARQFGEVMVPAFEAFYPIASSVIEKITNLSDRTKQIIVGVAGIAAAIGPVKLIMTGFGQAAAAAGGLLAAMVNPLTLAAGGFALLYKNSRRVRTVVDKLKKSFKFLFDALEYGTEPLKAVYQSLRVGFGADIADQFLEATDKIRTAWDSTISWFQNSAKYIKLAFNVGKSSGGIFGGLELSAKTAVARVQGVFSSLRIRASELIGRVNWSGIWDGITNTYDSLKAKAGEILGKLPGIIGGFAKDAANFIGSGKFAELGENIVGFLAAGIESKAGGGAARIINSLTNMFSGISLGDIDDNLRIALSNIGDIVIDVIAAGIGAAATGATALANAVAGVITSVDWSVAADSFTGAAGSIIVALGAALSQIDATALVQSLGTAVGAATGAFATVAVSIVADLASALVSPDTYIVLWNVGKTLISALWDGIRSGFKSTDFTEMINESIYGVLMKLGTTLGLSEEQVNSKIYFLLESETTVEGETPEEIKQTFKEQIEKDPVTAKLQLQQMLITGEIDQNTWAQLEGILNQNQPSNVTAEIPITPTISVTEGIEVPEGFGQSVTDAINASMNTSGIEITAAEVTGLTDDAKAELGAAGTEGGKAFGDNVAVGITAAQQSITDAANGIVKSVTTAMSNNYSSMTSAGLNFSRGLAAGIRAGRSIVVSAAASIAQAAANSARSTLKIHSPSKVTEGFGWYFGEGFAQGILGTVKLATNAAADLAHSAANATTVRNPGARVQAAYAASRTSGQVNIDYDRLADAMSQRPAILTQDGVVIAQVQARDNAIVRNGMERSIALGYGK